MPKIRPDSKIRRTQGLWPKAGFRGHGKGWPASPSPHSSQATLRLMPTIRFALSTSFPEVLCHSDIQRPTGGPTGKALAPPTPEHPRFSPNLDPGSETRSPLCSHSSQKPQTCPQPRYPVSSRFPPQGLRPPLLTIPWLLPFSFSLELFQLFPNWSPSLQPHHFWSISHYWDLFQMQNDQDPPLITTLAMTADRPSPTVQPHLAEPWYPVIQAGWPHADPTTLGNLNLLCLCSHCSLCLECFPHRRAGQDTHISWTLLKDSFPVKPLLSPLHHTLQRVHRPPT